MRTEGRSLWGAIGEVGAAISRSSIHRYLFGSQEGRQVASLLALGLLALGIWMGWILYRRSSWEGLQEAYRSPRKLLAWHGPWKGPLFVLALGTLLVLVCPVYLPGMARFRPNAWPEGPTLSARWGLASITGGALLGVVALLVGLRRSIRETIISSSHGDAAWAARSEIVIPPKPRVVMPFLVSYTGTSKDWRQGQRAAPARSRLEAAFRNLGRFLPYVNVAGLTPICFDSQTIWEHVLLTGHTGSGKGMGIFGPVIASAIASKTPIIYQDFKAECPGHNHLWAMTGEEPIRFGRAAKGGWPSMRWSALREALSDENPHLAVADLLAILAPNQGPGDFVSPPARNVLSHLILGAGFVDFSAIRDALLDESLIALMERTNGPKGVTTALSGQNMEQYVTDKILAVTTPYSVGWGRAVSSGHDFRIADIFRRGGYVLSAEPEPTLALPIKVFWRFILRHALQSAPDTKFRIILLFDEFLASGKVDNLAQGLQTLRSREVSIWAGIQTRSGVIANYGPVEGADVLQQFKSEIILLNGLSIDDRDHLQKFLGNKTVKEKTGRDTRLVPQPLLSVPDLNRRASRIRDFWAVFRVTGLSRSGRPVIGKAVPTVGRDFTCPPTEEELAEALTAYGEAPDLTPEERVMVREAVAYTTPAIREEDDTTSEITEEPREDCAPYFMRCTACGQDAPFAAFDCPHCGHPIAHQEAPRSSPPSPPSSLLSTYRLTRSPSGTTGRQA